MLQNILFLFQILNICFAAQKPGWCCKSKDWNVFIDDQTHVITMNPKGKHNMTIIFLHGAGGSAWTFFPMFERGRVAPVTAKIILL